MAEGDTVIKVKVTAEDGNATQTYTVTVTRAEAASTCTLNTGDLWCGVVTVGVLEILGSTVAYGFTGSGTGALSDTGFPVGTNSYTIDFVTVGTGTNAGVLQFSLTSDLTAADKAKLVLHIDGSSDTFAFSAASGPSHSNTYEWTSSGLDWSSTSEVTLRLREAAVSLSSDATLNALVVNDGNADLTLTPTFESGVYTYTASVANTVAEVTVTPTKSDTNATIEYLDESDATLDRRQHHGYRPSGGGGGGRHRHQGEGDGRGRQRHPDLHGDGEAGGGGRLDGRDAERSGRQRRHHGPDADADLRIEHHRLHGVGGDRRHRGDGDADEERFRRDDRISGRGRPTRRSPTRAPG